GVALRDPGLGRELPRAARAGREHPVEAEPLAEVDGRQLERAQGVLEEALHERVPHRRFGGLCHRVTSDVWHGSIRGSPQRIRVGGLGRSGPGHYSWRRPTREELAMAVARSTDIARIEEILGEEAEDLLTHECKTI